MIRRHIVTCNSGHGRWDKQEFSCLDVSGNTLVIPTGYKLYLGMDWMDDDFGGDLSDDSHEGDAKQDPPTNHPTNDQGQLPDIFGPPSVGRSGADPSVLTTSPVVSSKRLDEHP